MRFSCIMAWYALRPAFVLPPPSPPSSPPPLFRRAARRAASSRRFCHSARVAPSRNEVAGSFDSAYFLRIKNNIFLPIKTPTIPIIHKFRKETSFIFGFFILFSFLNEIMHICLYCPKHTNICTKAHQRKNE